MEPLRRVRRLRGGAELAAIDAEPDFFASIEALLDRSDDLLVHGDPFEQDASITLLFVPAD